jgi:hypothetical protein
MSTQPGSPGSAPGASMELDSVIVETTVTVTLDPVSTTKTTEVYGKGVNN